MELILERDVTISLGARAGRGGMVRPVEQRFAEVFVLLGTTPETKGVPKEAGLRWDGERRRWWTDDEQKARRLAPYARNGLRERWGLGATPAPQAPRPALGVVGAVAGTPQQEAFWAEVVAGCGHVVLMARAGCGKTFSVVEAARRAREERVGFCAFNSSIAKELREKMPPRAQALTLHSLGYAAVQRENRALGIGTRLDKEGAKVRAIIAALCPEALHVPTKKGAAPDRQLVGAVAALVSLCKSYLEDGCDLAALESLCQRHDVELAPSKEILARRDPSAKPPGQSFGEWEAAQDALYRASAFALVPQVLAECREARGTVDFDDMIWLPVVLGLPVEEFDLLFVDEAQDMNLCQQKLAFAACPEGRIVIVGDPRQSIYAFRGADTRSMERMGELLGATPRGCRTLPLTFTRRCPQAVVKLAQVLVPDIEAMPGAPEGVVEQVEARQVAGAAAARDMVVCRTNAPLVKVAYELLRAGKKPLLKGRDLGARIRGLIERLDARTPAELGERAAAHRAREVARLQAAQKAASVITQVEDDCETIDVLLEGCETLAQLEEKIAAIFDQADEVNAVSLSSVHGAKGLEADTVFLLCPHLMPHPNAKRPEDREQEQNIQYVALTRSKRRLVFAHDSQAEAALEDASAPAQEPPAQEPMSMEKRGAPSPERSAEGAVAGLEGDFEGWECHVRLLLQKVHEATPFDQHDLLRAIERAQAEVRG